MKTELRKIDGLYYRPMVCIHGNTYHGFVGKTLEEVMNQGFSEAEYKKAPTLQRGKTCQRPGCK